jgi:hypothetical protein
MAPNLSVTGTTKTAAHADDLVSACSAAVRATRECMTDSFERLIAPISFDVFLADYYEKRPLLIQNRAAEYYEDTISIQQISDHLADANISHPGIRLVKHGDELDPKEYTHSVTTSIGTDSIANKEKVFVRFYDGYTIILNSFERSCAGVRRLRHVTERAFSANAHANVYVTPRGSQGFKPHWDSHDVFVLQFEGTKAWTLYDSPVILPSKQRQFNDSEWTKVAPSLNVVLAPGDLLYIPRGFVHEATSTTEVSGHITLGITTFTYADIAIRLLDTIATDPWFRRSLPVNFKERIDATSLLSELGRFVSNIDTRAVVDRIYAEYASTRMPDAAYRLMDYIRLSKVNATTRFERKLSVFFDLDRDGGTVVVRFNNKAVRFPSVASACIQAVVDASSFRIEDLPDDLDIDSKIVVCKKLVEEGFLSIAE